MPAHQQYVSQALYRQDVWAGFTPIEVSDEVQGWNGDHPSLTKVASLSEIKTIVDVGVWQGQSTITMARELKRLGLDACVIAVDTFLGSPEHWYYSDLYSRCNSMPNVFDIFMSNVWKAGVSEYVVPLPQTSVTAALVLRNAGIKASLVHVDAAHEYQEVLRDVEEYYERLEDGGTMIGDDYHKTWPGVIRAVGEFSARKNLPLEIELPKWIVRKPISSSPS